jgi:hypothetical protein
MKKFLFLPLFLCSIVQAQDKEMIDFASWVRIRDAVYKKMGDAWVSQLKKSSLSLIQKNEAIVAQFDDHGSHKFAVSFTCENVQYIECLINGTILCVGGIIAEAIQKFREASVKSGFTPRPCYAKNLIDKKAMWMKENHIVVCKKQIPFY